MSEIPFPGSAVDGATFFHEDKVCLYHEATNTWECRTISSETPQPPSEVVYTTDVYIPDYTPDPDTYNIRATLDELNEKEGGVRRAIQTQADLNQESLYTLLNQRRKGTRNKTTVDFLQNTVTEGDWEYEPADQGNALPAQGYFHLFDKEGNPTSNWAETFLININGTGRNSEDLADIRRGAVVNMQDVLINTFAQFVVERVAFIGNPQGGQYWVEMEVSPRYGRAVGIIPDGAVCELQVISTYPCITSANRIAPPKVNNDGYLWYDEDTMTLYVSNWDDLQDPNGSCTWLAADGTHLIREVLYVGDNLDALLAFNGSVLSGDGQNWQLRGTRFPLTTGMKIIIADQETKINSVETITTDDGKTYVEIETADSITLDQETTYETRFTAPMIGGHPYWNDLHNQGGGGGGGGDYLPLTGGTIDGQLTVNGVEIVNGAQVIELDSPGSLFTVLDYPEGNAVLVVNGAGSGKYLGKQTVDENIATLGYCNDNYLSLTTGGLVNGNVAVSGLINNQGGIIMAGPKESALNIADLQGGTVFSAHCDKFGSGVSYYGAIELNNHITTKQYVDTAVGSIDLDGYLPLAGGTMTGDIVMNGKKITGLGSATQGGMAVSRNYGDDRYLQMEEGGQMRGEVKFVEATKLQMGGTYNNNIIDKASGFTDNSLVPTLGYVNHQIAAIGDSVGGSGRLPGTAKYTWAEGREFISLRPGEISGFTADYTQTSILSDIKYLSWNGVDKDGNRPAPDLNAVDFNSWCSTLQLMNEECTSTFLRSVGGSHLGKDFNVFQYNKDLDIYFVGWDNTETAVPTSTMIRFLPGQILSLRMPDWFL